VLSRCIGSASRACRAPTLGGAIGLHGGEAASSRGRFQALSTAPQKEVIGFLDNLVLFKLPEEQ